MARASKAMICSSCTFISRDCESKANLKKGFLVLDISGTPLRVRKAPGLSSMGVGQIEIEFKIVVSTSKNKARQVHTMMLGQLLGHDLVLVEKRLIFQSYFVLLAEREGFEPPIPLRVCRISSAVHSTTLPPLRTIEIVAQSVITLIEQRGGCYPFATQSFYYACLLRPPDRGQRERRHLPASPAECANRGPL